ncbi:MAG: class I SAM-dependent methyltransferase [Chloroflexi bacterium]|nr:class I SAM-dependent methyltransferase [Chloroflexota bacterium]MBI3169227.1 class I SAM-dependent methyltransferase [Chloroflexota bacterium]
MTERDMNKAALRGEPSYVWRAGQIRRLNMIQKFAGERMQGKVLENGCGVGMYVEKMTALGANVTGLEFDFDRARDAHVSSEKIVNAAGEFLPLPSSTFDLILSHEVIEHVQDDRLTVREMVRVLRSPDPTSGKVGGRAAIFCPNRGYPVETHGIFWKGKYYFGNKLFVNYLPRVWRDKLAPHVRVYSRRDLQKLFDGLPVKFIERTVIFGAYDNIIARTGVLGKIIRAVLQFAEATPLKILGLSHFWVVEKV